MTPVQAMAAALHDVDDDVQFCRRDARNFPVLAGRLLSVIEASGYHLSMKEAAPDGAELTLDEAWAEAEAALPEAFRVRVEGLASGYMASVVTPEFRAGSFVRSKHATPTAALRELVALLRREATAQGAATTTTTSGREETGR